MNKEIERKFLVLNETFKKSAIKSAEIIQCYLSKDPKRTVRIRIKGENAYLTVKGISKNKGAERFEYETTIDKQDALQLTKLCLPGKIIKTRYYVPYKNHTFEVDIFEAENKGLILAEIELDSVNENFEKPDWLGKEVTGDKRYYNSYLSEHPFSEENKNEKINFSIAGVAEKMIDCFNKDVRRINHALKVFSYAQIIGKLENIPPETQKIIEISALLHDIGIKICEEKYGSVAGKYQEIESPPIAKQLLHKFTVPEKELNRILFIIGNHHSYNKIDDIDFQILVEADFLVNFEEGNEPTSSIPSVKKKIFKTKTGIRFLETIFQ